MLLKTIQAFFSQRYRTQILVTLTVHILTLSHGISIGWLAPTLLILQSPQSPLNFNVTTNDISWIGSTFGIGALCGNILILITLKCFSRKMNMCLMAIPHLLFWIFSYFAQGVEYLYAARLCAGITSGCIYVLSPIFLSEITEKEVRGALTSMAMMFLSCGILIGYTLPTYLDYHLIPCLVVFLSIIYLITMSYFPETPAGLLQQERLEDAKTAFDFYRNMKLNNISKNEMGVNKMQTLSIYNEFEELKISKLHVNNSTSLSWHDFVNKSALKKFALAFVIVIQNQFSGYFALVSYMSHIFAVSGSTLDPKQCTIVIGVVQICGTLLACILVERFGRKTLMLLSTFSMATVMFCFGAFIQYTNDAIQVEYDWVPLVAVTFIIATASIGVISLTFTIIVEILPSKIRPEAQSISMMVCSICLFISLKLYPYFLFNLGISITMYSCAASSVLTGTYLLIFLPETKGKSMTQD